MTSGRELFKELRWESDKSSNGCSFLTPTLNCTALAAARRVPVMKPYARRRRKYEVPGIHAAYFE